jgi:pimeloyl-ACP methyl ester carboxylesterase
LRDYAEDIIGFLQQISEPAHIFGHSLGGGVALLVAALCAERVRSVAVGDAPLSGETWYSAVSPTWDRIAAWRELAGGQHPIPDMIEALKEAPIELPERAAPVRMRDAYGEDAPVFEWLATNLYYNDPDMLTILLDDFESFVAGYEMAVILPAIRCPVLLLQADAAAGGLMTDAEVKQALRVLASPTHVQLKGVSHALYNQGTEPVLRELVDFFGQC